MAFIPALNCAKITAVYNQTGVPAANIFHCRYSGVFDESQAIAIADAFTTVWNAQMMPDLASGLVYTSCEVRDLEVEAGEVYNITTDLPQAGGVSQEFANNVALTITWQTGAAGRSQRGRSYIPGCPVGAYQKESFLDAFVTNMQTNASAVIDAMTSADYPLVVASYYHNLAPRTTASLRDILSGRANKPVHTMRKRLV